MIFARLRQSRTGTLSNGSYTSDFMHNIPFVVSPESIFIIFSATATSCASSCKTFTSISHLALPKRIHDISISCRQRFRLPRWLASIVVSSAYFTFRCKPSVNQSKTSFVADVTSKRSFSACIKKVYS